MFLVSTCNPPMFFHQFFWLFSYHRRGNSYFFTLISLGSSLAVGQCRGSRPLAPGRYANDSSGGRPLGWAHRKSIHQQKSENLHSVFQGWGLISCDSLLSPTQAALVIWIWGFCEGTQLNSWLGPTCPNRLIVTWDRSIFFSVSTSMEQDFQWAQTIICSYLFHIFICHSRFCLACFITAISPVNQGCLLYTSPSPRD